MQVGDRSGKRRRLVWGKRLSRDRIDKLGAGAIPFEIVRNHRSRRGPDDPLDLRMT